MQSKATTAAAYLAELSPERRAAIEAVRKVILDNLDEGIEEGMQYGMICYYIPHSIFPAGYHCDPKIPLGYCGLASQVQYMSFYLGWPYCGCGRGESAEDSKDAQWFRKAWAKTGKKLDMGKSCIRFKKVEDLALDVIAESIRRVPTKDYIDFYVKSREAEAAKKSALRLATKKKSAAKAGSKTKRKA